jgi:hypothetical protein
MKNMCNPLGARMREALVTFLPGLAVACSPGLTAAGPSVDAAPGPGDTANDAAASSSPQDAGPTDAAAEAEAAYVPVATQVLDDLAGPVDAPGAVRGWGTYSDRTASWSEPPIFVSDAGILMPTEEARLTPIADGSGPVYRGAAWPYLRFSGGGEVIWGAGLAMSFANAPPDGGPVPMNQCDAGVVFDVDADGGDSWIQLPFDASGWTGIQFWAKSFIGLPRGVTVLVEDDRVNPFGLAIDAGGCNVCSAGGVGGCGDAPRATAVFQAEWTQIQIPFASMHPNGWSGDPGTRTPDLATIYAINFELDTTIPTPPFDLAVAYVELYR